MKSSSLVLGRGTFLQKTLASFAILAVLTLTVPIQAFAESTDPVADSGTPATNPVDPGTLGTSTDPTPPDSQDVSTSTDNTDIGTPPLLHTFSFISHEEDTPGCKLVSDDVNTYIGSNPAVDTYTHPAWSTELNSDGAKWIWNAYHVSNPTQPETVTFTRSFNVSGSPGTATLKIAADNGYTVSVNTIPVPACDGTGGFSSVDTCTIPVVTGPNTITFTATNAAGNSDPESNPAGLYYEINVTGASCTEIPPARTSTVTMCKVSDADGHPGLPGWQIYLKGDLFNKITLNSASTGGVNSSWLTNGVQYLVTSMGTWSNQNGANLVDAEYSTTDNWTTHVDGYPGFGPGILELEVNNADTNWGPYNNSHTYSQIITGTGAQVHFGVFDGDTGTHTQNPSWYTDNSGKLFIDINSAYAGTTGENGCVTLHNVPFGTYTAGEIAKDGWTLTNITGAQGSAVDGNSVVVDSPTEHFTFVNHHEVPQEPQSCVIVSDAITLEGGEPSFVATFIHSAWTAVIDGASWIWGDPAITDPVNEQTQVFTKKFSLASAPATDATLMIAADNSYSVKVNGIVVGSDSGEFNYTAAGQDSITIPAADLHAGANTLEITVTNFKQKDGTQFTNPAGLKYKLTIGGTSCTQDAPTYKVHIFKYLDNGEGGIAQVPNNATAPKFPMIATYNIAGIGSNLNPGDDYVLGNGGGVGGSDNGLLWAANTIPLHAGDVYGTHEVTGGDSPVVANSKQCSPGKYYLEGYKVGDSLSDAQSATISQTAPNFSSISKSEYVIVVNKKCADAPIDGGGDGGNTTGTLTIVKDTSGGDGQFTFNVSRNEANHPVQVTTASGVGTSTIQLANGIYSVVEADADGWTYNSVDCKYDGENVGTTIPDVHGKNITISNGDNVTCTFHNTKTVIPFVTFLGGGGGGGGGGGQGKVLGVSTTTQGQVLGATCSPILTSYLGIGKKNPIDQVIVLQNFLNGNLKITLPVTGFFGPLTFQAVKDFQKKYFSDVLTPWVPLGLPTDHTPTGYVYKTTKWMINHIACSEADGPKPKLP